jgi:Transposase IS116/IS110/IS902 family
LAEQDGLTRLALTPLACKTDRVDARVRADQTRRELVPEVWVPSTQERANRERLRRRSQLIRLRTSAIYRTFGLLTQWGLRRGLTALRKDRRYSGLTPTIKQSGQSSRTGRISKAGPNTLRWAAVEAAQQAWRPTTNPWHRLYTDTKTHHGMANPAHAGAGARRHTGPAEHLRRHAHANRPRSVPRHATVSSTQLNRARVSSPAGPPQTSLGVSRGLLLRPDKHPRGESGHSADHLHRAPGLPGRSILSSGPTSRGLSGWGFR